MSRTYSVRRPLWYTYEGDMIVSVYPQDSSGSVNIPWLLPKWQNGRSFAISYFEVWLVAYVKKREEQWVGPT